MLLLLSASLPRPSFFLSSFFPFSFPSISLFELWVWYNIKWCYRDILFVKHGNCTNYKIMIPLSFSKWKSNFSVRWVRSSASSPFLQHDYHITSISLIFALFLSNLALSATSHTPKPPPIFLKLSFLSHCPGLSTTPRLTSFICEFQFCLNSVHFSLQCNTPDQGVTKCPSTRAALVGS